jgi:surface protein
MWDMFHGCVSLKNLSIPNFDTSKVTDMQSMFSGCKSLISLNLNHFNTTLVQYMNEMFQDCENLKYLSMSQLISDSLGTMYRMFYGCRSLEYLNLFPLIEKVESINEMFTGTSDNFKICIQDIKNIPNIFEIIKNKNIKRDCSEDCYGEGNNRTLIESQKRCCPLYYNGNCYYECPGKTRIDEDNPKICNKFNCDAPKYYNFEQNNCDYLPIGYYVNYTIGRTIDK